MLSGTRLGCTGKPAAGYDAETIAADLAAIGPADLDEYVAAITQTGALRAGPAVYQDFFTSAEQVAARARKPLTIPVRAYGGTARLGEPTLAPVRAVAPAASSTAVVTGRPRRVPISSPR